MSTQLPAISDVLVRESHQADAGRKIARLPEHMLDRLHVEDDDRVVELDGFSTTLVEAYPVFDTQADDAVYLPEQIAEDAGTQALGRITVRKAHPPVAEQVVFRPTTEHYLTWPGTAPDGVQDYLNDLPVTPGDSFAIEGSGPVKVPVIVTNVTPDEGGLITPATTVEFE